MTAPATSLFRVPMTYLGRRLNSAGKLTYLWQFDDGATAAWGKKNLTPIATIGQVWEVTFSDPEHTSAYTGGESAPRFLRLCDDTARIAEWSLLERAARTTFEMDARAKRETGDGFAGVLAPIKAAMRKTNPAGRAAIIAAVVQELGRYL